MAKKLGVAESFIVAAELRSGGVITEQEILALKKRWSRAGTWDDEIERVTDHGPYRISNEQAAKGLHWWLKNTQKADGNWRNNKLVAQMGNDKLYVLSCFDHFLLDSWWEECPGYRRTSYSPVYRACSTTGDSFAYVGRPWQSGGVEFV